MNTWLVIYTGTQIASSLGPQNYDMLECEKRAQSYSIDLRVKTAHMVDAEGFTISPEQADKQHAITFRCVISETRPTEMR